jgi:hypothetical protein
MSEADTWRRKADHLLGEASKTSNMRERGRLIDEAMHFHRLAMDATGHESGRLRDSTDGAGREANG